MEQGEIDPDNEEKNLDEQPNPSKELLVMTVEIGDGRQDTIAIHEHDDPVQLARAFAEKHGLEASLQQSLVSLIHENKEMIKKKEHQNEGQSMDWMASNSMSPSQRQGGKTKGPKKPKKGTVYDRIYQQLKKNNTSVSEQSEMNKSRSSVTFNYGEYLYLRGMKKKEELKKKGELKVQAIEDSELPELTFSPAINKQSSFMAPRQAEHPEEILNRKGKEYQERLEKLKESQDKVTLKECKFTPKINKVSKEQVRTERIHVKLHDLHSHFKQKHEKQADQEIKQLPFKPAVNKIKNKHLESKEELFDRLDASGRVIQEKNEAKRKLKETQEFDEETGQKLFYPKTNTQSEKRFVTETVWEVLYSHNLTKKQELEKLKNEQHKFLQENSESKKVCESSDKIFHEFRLRQYERLFRTMDSDEDGLISANSIRIDQVSEQALLILAPFLEELASSQDAMNFESFCSKLDILYKSLNVAQRSVLLKKESKTEAEEGERKPFISLTSIAMAEKKRTSMPKDMYERLTTANKMTEMKVQKIKDERQKKFEAECTFKPALKTS